MYSALEYVKNIGLVPEGVPVVEPTVSGPSERRVNQDTALEKAFSFGIVTGYHRGEDIYELTSDLSEGHLLEARGNTLVSEYPVLCGDHVKIFYNVVEDEEDDERVSRIHEIDISI